MENFNRLQQTGTLDDYIAKFKELKALFLMTNPTMPESYFLESFIGGLKAAVKPLVRAFNPRTVDDAIEQGRFQEEHILALKIPPDRTFRQLSYPAPVTQKSLPAVPPNPISAPQKALLPTPHYSSQGSNTKTTASTWHRPTGFIPAAERADKITKGLCYFCDQPFERGPKCGSKEKQLFLVELMDDPEGNQEGEDNGADIELLECPGSPQISLQALHGNVGFQTMRVMGHVGKRQIHILIDSGSTHNFLDEKFAKECGSPLEAMRAQSITIVGGDKLL